MLSSFAVADEPSLCLRLTRSDDAFLGDPSVGDFEVSSATPRTGPHSRVRTELAESGAGDAIPIPMTLTLEVGDLHSDADSQRRRLARAKFRRYPLLEIPAVDPSVPALRTAPIGDFELSREARGFVVIDADECRRVGFPARQSKGHGLATGRGGKAALCVGVAIPMVVALAPAEALAGVGTTGSSGSAATGGQDLVTVPVRIEGPALPMPVVPAHAQPPSGDLPDASWQGLHGRSVEITRTDGSLMIGEVTGSDPTTVTLIGTDGSVLVIARGMVSSVKVLQGPAAPVAEPGQPQPQPAPGSTAPPPVPPPPVDEKKMRTGTALVISGAAVMGAGLITTLVGAGVSLRHLTRRSTCGTPYCSLNYDPGYYALVIVVPGVAVMFGVGLPLLIAGAAVRGKAKRGGTSYDPKQGLVFNHQKGVKKGQPKLTLSPSGPRRGWGGGLRLRF